MIEKIRKASLSGEVFVPASKSHTIRALLIASLAEGESIIRNPLHSADTKSCISACRLFGADIVEKDGALVVRGTAGEPRVPENVVDTGNSGTTLYLAAGIAGLVKGWTVFTGDHQIRSRPIGPLLNSLTDLGAQAFSTRNNGCAPVAIKGPLRGGSTSIECPTSQYLSSLLIASPLVQGDTVIHVPLLNERPYVEMTLRWLSEQGITYKNEEFGRFLVPGMQAYKCFTKAVPGDFSSATFFLCAAAITGSELTLHGLDMEDSQGDKAVVSMLVRMGCTVSVLKDRLVIKGNRLTGCDLDLNDTPDALPALAATACFAQGKTRLYNVPQARLKETDRIAVMAQELAKLGATVEELPDGLIVSESKLKGTHVHGHHDHRVVMSLAIAGLGATGVTSIETAEAVDITYPGFFDIVRSLSAKNKN